MLSPLFDSHNFLFDENLNLDDGWNMTSFQQETAALTGMEEFWADVEAEAESLNIVPPATGGGEDENEISDWAIRSESDEHREQLVHHDCMWTGYCGDSGHPSNTFVPAEPVMTLTTGRSLLKRSTSPPRSDTLSRHDILPRPETPPRPDTPPSLDEDEPPQFQHSVDVAGTALRLLRDSAAVAADHSYTLAKPAAKIKFENLGVQTPSDSEEEIDVVSVSEKCAVSPLSPLGRIESRSEPLPHEPSDMERRRLQRSMACAMSPRAPRKRTSPPSSSRSSPGYTPPRKRARGPGRRPRRSSPDSDSDGDVPDLEKRSLHNDMERMRRIGLKNLFDQLKDQIPSIKDKERAPKVVILREATTLCLRLQGVSEEREYLQREQNRLMNKLKRLRMQHGARFYAP